MKKPDIKKIFKGEIAGSHDQIIKTIDVNQNRHKIGLINILRSKVENYTIDAANKDVLNTLFNYFIGDKLFCTENNIDLNKGILLCGGVGTGKSIIMHAFKDYACEINRMNGFQYYTAIDIIDSVNVSGVDYLEKFSYNFTGNIANPITCYIDDIASKNEIVKNYGTEISVIEQLISIRYNIYSRYRKLTHFSSNIYPANFKDYYDLRIVDRIKEMCNVISLPGESRRT